MRLFDVLGPVMIGPSSSHTAGAAKIGYTAQKLLGDIPVDADIGLYGSFATTGRGHGTDRALVAGLLGLRPDDPRLPDSFGLAKEQGMKFSIHPVELRSAHPNTAVLRLTSRTGRVLSMKAASVGGGRIRVTEIDGVPADFGGDSNPHHSQRRHPRLHRGGHDLAGAAADQHRVDAGVPRRDGQLRRHGAGMRFSHPPPAGAAACADARHPESDLPERRRTRRKCGGLSDGFFIL